MSDKTKMNAQRWGKSPKRVEREPNIKGKHAQRSGSLTRNEGLKWVVLIALSLVISLLLFPNILSKPKVYKLGDVAGNDIKASSDFLIENKELTENNREDAVKGVFSVYDFDTSSSNLISRIKEVFKAGREYVKTKSQGVDAPLASPPPAGAVPSCAQAGVLGTLPGVIGCLQATEALKILIGDQGTGNVLVHVDLWEGRFGRLHIEPNPSCPTCVRRRFDFLHGNTFSEAFSLCGRNAVQISPAKDSKIDLERLKERLGPLGDVFDNGFFLSFKVGQHELIIFPEGRTMIKGTTDESIARTLFAKYVGA